MHIDPKELGVPIMSSEEIGKSPRWRIELASRARDLMFMGVVVVSDKAKAYGRVQSITADPTTGVLSVHVSFMGGLSVVCDEFAKCRIVATTLSSGDLPDWIEEQIRLSKTALERQERINELRNLIGGRG